MAFILVDTKPEKKSHKSEQGNVFMLTSGKAIIAVFAFLPTALIASQMEAATAVKAVSATEFAYSGFVLGSADEAAIMSTIAASCPKKSDDSGSIMSAEARYQTACLGKQVKRLEKRHERDYQGSKRDLSAQAQQDFSMQYLGWVKTRYAECETDRNENLGGAMKNALFASCKLFELKRRAKWRGVQY